jgi:hypothetical protein
MAESSPVRTSVTLPLWDLAYCAGAYNHRGIE